MNQPISSLIVAEHLLYLRRNLDTTPMHILKLVYLCHGWMLGIHGEPLITDHVEAWTYGPVVPALYSKYKRFGGGIIIAGDCDHSSELAEQQRDIIEVVEEAYRDYTAGALSNLTHQPNTPWDRTRRRSRPVIDDQLIREHFESLLLSAQSS